MRKTLSFVIGAAIALSTVGNIFANDQITLKNGDRVSGKIVKQDSDTIIIESEIAGLITISKTKVDKIQLDASYVKEDAKETVKEEEKPTADATEKAEAAPAAPAPKRQSSLTDGWDGAANVGLSLTSGNANSKTITAGVRAEKAGASDKWTTYGNMLWNTNKIGTANVTTSNALWGGLRYDKNLTKKVFAFGSFDFERDIPQKLNFRSVLGAGLGVHAIQNDKTQLDLFGGAAWNKSWFIGPNRSSAELVVGNTLKHKFNDRVKFQQGFSLYPNLTQTGNYRYVFDSTLTTDLTTRIGWFMTVADRFNSLPLAGVKKNDFLFATGLKVGFGKK